MVRALDKVDAMLLFSSALPSASPMSFHQRCICDSCRLHRLVWMTSAHTMIRKSTANCTRTVTTSSCASTTAESKKCRGCNKSFKTLGSTTPEFCHRAPRTLRLRSHNRIETSTDDRTRLFLPLRLSLYCVYDLVIPTLSCATPRSVSTVN